MQIINKLINLIKNNKKNIFYTILFLTIFSLSFDNSFAAPDDGSDINGLDSSAYTANNAGNTFLNSQTTNVLTVNMLISRVVVIIGILTQIIGYFLSPGWTTGADIGILPKLKDLWILVSNIVYFVFALIFVGVAILNIVGKSDDYAFRSAIPRFIVGIIIVPFSWFIVQFILSITTILTVSVLSLPFDSFKDFNSFIHDSRVCKNLVQKNEKGSSTITVKCEDSVKSSLSNMNMYGILNYYTYGVMKIDQKLTLNEDVVKDVKDVFGLIAKLGFDVIFLIVYLLLLMALGLSLLVRGIVLWVFMVLSPLFGLLFFIKKDPEALKNFGFMDFVKLAMVPVYVSAALSFGLLFMYSVSTSITKTNVGECPKDKSFCIKKADSGTGITLTVGIGEDKSSVTTNLFTNSKFDIGAVSTKVLADSGLGGFILQLFSLGILWVAIMAALKSSEITNSVSAPIGEIGKNAWETIKKAPSAMPIVPTGQGTMSMNNLSQVSRTLSSNIQSIGQDNAVALGNSISETLGITANKTLQELQKLNNNKFNGSDFNNSINVENGLNQLLSKLDPKDIQSTQIRAELSKSYGMMGMKQDDITALEKESTFERYAEKLSDIIKSSDGMKIKPTTLSEFTTDKIKEKIKNTSGAQTPGTARGSYIQGGIKEGGKDYVGVIINTIVDNNNKFELSGGRLKNQKDIEKFSQALINANETDLTKDKLTSVGITDSPQQDSIIAKFNSLKPKPNP